MDLTWDVANKYYMGLTLSVFRMSLLKKCLVAAVIAAVVAGGLVAGMYKWANSPVDLASPELDVTIKSHSTLRSVSIQLNRGGAHLEPELFVLMTRALGLSAQLKSGNYAFKAGITPYEMLQKIARGDVNEYVATIIEGWTFQKMRNELDGNPALQHDTAGMTDTDLLKAIGAPDDVTAQATAEGLFFPDTYLFDKGTSDIAVYKRAYNLMQQRLSEAWNTRAQNLPYKTPYDALIMASIVEKETGRAADRPLVAAVFANRLRIGMPLQTDPSVIYGLGSAYGGRLQEERSANRHSVQYLHAHGPSARSDRAAGRRGARGDASILRPAPRCISCRAATAAASFQTISATIIGPSTSTSGDNDGARQIHHV